MLRGLGEKIGRIVGGDVKKDQYQEEFSPYKTLDQIDGQMERAYDQALAEARGERTLVRSGASGLLGDSQRERLDALHRKLNDYDDRTIAQLKQTEGKVNFARDLGWLQREVLRQFMRSGGEAKVLDKEALRSAINSEFRLIPPEREFDAAIEVLRQYITKGEANGKKLK